ncbi:hypothetical protein CROQUDRAFT_110602 [Cronartium quercuum f. sp. fusiforme G11]|uniref:Uncharacterized protein n=1 Tax=Cronartium quercuum f. sp. fusiforme G11 TaxID=708437 RepID=A0A9P6T6U9_9BASI|nr:hypothetical protein CROQUDRAFT_110602 [Cronartium quercuum f. sp. fusiforme G11]
MRAGRLTRDGSGLGWAVNQEDCRAEKNPESTPGDLGAADWQMDNVCQFDFNSAKQPTWIRIRTLAVTTVGVSRQRHSQSETELFKAPGPEEIPHHHSPGPEGVPPHHCWDPFRPGFAHTHGFLLHALRGHVVLPSRLGPPLQKGQGRS